MQLPCPLATEAASASTETPQTAAATSIGTCAVTGTLFRFTWSYTDRPLRTFCKLTFTRVGTLLEVGEVVPEVPVAPPVEFVGVPVLEDPVVEPEELALGGVGVLLTPDCAESSEQAARLANATGANASVNERIKIPPFPSLLLSTPALITAIPQGLCRCQ